jgi:hypothetical protein
VKCDPFPVNNSKNLALNKGDQQKKNGDWQRPEDLMLEAAAAGIGNTLEKEAI